MHHNNSNPWKSGTLGALSGLAGVAAMNVFMAKTSRFVERKQDTNGEGQAEMSLVGRQHREGESATAAVGRIAYKWITHREPESAEMKSALSHAVHWGYGVDMAMLYGMARGGGHGADLAGGMAFGTVLWIAGDELAVPMLGLAEGPLSQPPGLHLQTLGAHLVYGVTTAVTLSALHRFL